MNDIRAIMLRNGGFTVVDESQFARLNSVTWRRNRGGYADRVIKVDGKRKTLQIHRLANNTPEGLCTDHINGHKLDNSGRNLRSCTHSQNNHHRMRKKQTHSDEKYFGVTKNWNKWESGIRINGKNIYLGLFETPEQAAMAYNDAATKYFGEFAHHNIIQGGK